VGPSNGLVYCVLGRVYQEQLGDREKAVAAYQKALTILNPDRREAQDARSRLRALGGEDLPFAAWKRRVGAMGQSLETDQRFRLPRWLRAGGYDLRLPADAPVALQLASQGVQILIWQGRRSDYPLAEEVRAYVASGGKLLICLGSQESIGILGPILATIHSVISNDALWERYGSTDA
jgi:tetratricopeptide (TPR) repeat protein